MTAPRESLILSEQSTGYLCATVDSEPTTVPVMYSFVQGALLEKSTATVFVNLPGRPAGSYVTVMAAVSPGATASREYLGDVHPQEA